MDVNARASLPCTVWLMQTIVLFPTLANKHTELRGFLDRGAWWRGSPHIYFCPVGCFYIAQFMYGDTFFLMHVKNSHEPAR